MAAGERVGITRGERRELFALFGRSFYRKLQSKSVVSNLTILPQPQFVPSLPERRGRYSTGGNAISLPTNIEGLNLETSCFDGKIVQQPLLNN